MLCHWRFCQSASVNVEGTLKGATDCAPFDRRLSCFNHGGLERVFSSRQFLVFSALSCSLSLPRYTLRVFGSESASRSCYTQRPHLDKLSAFLHTSRETLKPGIAKRLQRRSLACCFMSGVQLGMHFTLVFFGWVSTLVVLRCPRAALRSRSRV